MAEPCPSVTLSYSSLCAKDDCSAYKIDTVGSVLGRENNIDRCCLHGDLVCRCEQVQEMTTHVLSLALAELSHPRALAMKNKKATKKFAASGKLKQTIQARHKQQKLKKQIDGRRQRKAAKGRSGRPGTGRIAPEDVDMDDGDDVKEPSRPPKASSKGKSKLKPQKEVDIEKPFLDGEDDEVRCEFVLRVCL